MKKLLFAFALLITCYTFATAQKKIVAPVEDTQTVANDSAQSIQEFLIQFDAWRSVCGEEGLSLIQRGRALGVNVVEEFKDLPAPTTQEAVKQWTDKIDLLFGGLGSIATMLLTFLLSLFKKDPSGTLAKFQSIFNGIRTRYLLAISSLAVAGFGIFYFKDGSVGLADILSGLGLALGVAVGGMGVKGLLELVGINLNAKKAQ